MTTYNATLGVCIPTYKRPEQLLRCVRSVIAAARPHDVPIFIADDSTDETNADVLAQLRGEYPHVLVSHNGQNLGIDRNIVNAVNLCACDYAWLMGEDDRMRPEAVTQVLAALTQSPPAFVFVNYAYVDERMSVILRQRQLPLPEDRCEDAETFFRRDGWATGFIGSCVIEKRLWGAVKAETYFDTYFAHVGVIFEAIRGGRVCLLADPLVLNRVGGAEVFTWSGDAYGVFSGWSEVARRLEPLYGRDACRAAAAAFEAGHGLNTLRFLCAKRADRQYTPDVYRRHIRTGPRGPLYKCAALLVAAAPPQPFKALQKLLSQVRRRRNMKLAGYG